MKLAPYLSTLLLVAFLLAACSRLDPTLTPTPRPILSAGEVVAMVKERLKSDLGPNPAVGRSPTRPIRVCYEPLRPILGTDPDSPIMLMYERMRSDYEACEREKQNAELLYEQQSAAHRSALSAGRKVQLAKQAADDAQYASAWEPRTLSWVVTNELGVTWRVYETTFTIEVLSEAD